MASLRLQVTPRDTAVYVDGYYAGTADDFDGMFQRLHVDRGEHEVTLYLPAHRTVTQKVLLGDGTFRIRHAMEPLAPGETAEPVPAPAPTAAPRRAMSRAVRPPRQQPSRDQVRGDAAFGAISIRVQPADAEVLLDGERWDGPDSDEALVVQLSPGTHRIEVRKEGYRSYSAEVNVSAGQTSPLNVSLSRQ
jgi:hypothetical protein